MDSAHRVDCPAADKVVPPPPRVQAPPSMTREEQAEWHGYLCCGMSLPAPRCVCASDEFSRPEYTKTKAAEFADLPEVLSVKADVLVAMIRASKNMMMYTGAGISTSSGIRDYASKAKGSTVQQSKISLTHAFIRTLNPTPSHRVVVALEKEGFVKHWLQQNHDGLAQKAGFPHDKINEIHGSWHDRTNPVVKMSGELRGDLFQWMLEWEKQADFVLALGTSFSGMNADRCATACAERHRAHNIGQGLAIVTIQKTPMDKVAGLRVFSKLDDFMMLVAAKMKLSLDTKVYDPAPPKALQEKRLRELKKLKNGKE